MWPEETPSRLDSVSVAICQTEQITNDSKGSVRKEKQAVGDKENDNICHLFLFSQSQEIVDQKTVAQSVS